MNKIYTKKIIIKIKVCATGVCFGYYETITTLNSLIFFFATYLKYEIVPICCCIASLTLRCSLYVCIPPMSVLISVCSMVCLCIFIEEVQKKDDFPTLI